MSIGHSSSCRRQQLRDFIVREMTDRKTVASDGSGGERERLPGVPYVVQAVSICPVAILPRLAPRNAGQDKHDWRGAAGQLHLEIAQRTLFGHVRRGTVMVQPIGPLLQAPCEEVEFGRVQIPGGWIHAQRVPVAGGRNALGRADRSGIEQQLRKERRAVAGGCGAETTVEHIERRHFRCGRICRQVEHRHALVMTEGIGHVRPVEDLRRSPQRFNAVLSRFVIFAPRHYQWMYPLRSMRLRSNICTANTCKTSRIQAPALIGVDNTRKMLLAAARSTLVSEGYTNPFFWAHSYYRESKSRSMLAERSSPLYAYMQTSGLGELLGKLPNEHKCVVRLRKPITALADPIGSR